MAIFTSNDTKLGVDSYQYILKWLPKAGLKRTNQELDPLPLVETENFKSGYIRLWEMYNISQDQPSEPFLTILFRQLFSRKVGRTVYKMAFSKLSFRSQGTSMDFEC